MNIQLSSKQIKYFSSSIVMTDVLNYIKNDYDNYLKFLNDELTNNNISDEEYKEEINLINNIKNN